MDKSKLRLVVIMASYNRRDLTLQCLKALFDSDSSSFLDIVVYLVDSGSTDGTLEAVTARFDVRTSRVENNVYWAEAMRVAWERAREVEDWDYLMWLNNDVMLFSDWLDRLTAEFPPRLNKVHIGQCEDPHSGNPTYGGFRRGPRFRRLAFRPVFSQGAEVDCDTLNGNVMLVGRDCDALLGGFPRGYRHNLADLVYGLRARRNGIPVVVSRKSVGVCARDSKPVWEDRSLSMRARFRSTVGAKGFPPKQWIGFCLKYGGMTGVFYAMRPYVRMLRSSFTSDVSQT